MRIAPCSSPVRPLAFVDAGIRVPAGTVAATVVSGQVWAVTASGELRRLTADGQEVGAPLPLAALAGDVTIVGVQRGSRAALIESDQWCGLIRECADGSCVVEQLGARTKDRRVLVAARIAERQAANIRLGQLELAIPADLASTRIGASAVVLDGSTLLVELAHVDRGDERVRVSARYGSEISASVAMYGT